MGRGQTDRGDGPLTTRPFDALRELRERLPDGGDDRTPEETPSPPKLKSPSGTSSVDRDADLLAQALADVKPLGDDKRRVLPSKEAAAPRGHDEDRAVKDYLKDLVDGAVPFDIADTDEYIEGAVQGLDRRVVRRLRKGEYSIQDHVDLHGMNREEARDAVARFIRSASGRGLRCVLVVHGRGLRSKDQIPVLKEKLKAWLTRGALGDRVLAFTTAQRYDGGAGAAYVLLRK